MKKINYKLLLICVCLCASASATTEGVASSVPLTQSLEDNCADIHLNDFDSERLLNCINLLKMGVDMSLPIAQYLSAQALYSGKNMPENKALSKRLFATAAGSKDSDGVNDGYRLLAKVALKTLY
jgi:hypothetical protein